MEKEQKQIRSLTGLKGVFIMLIVMSHTLPDTPLIRSIPLTSLLSEYGGLWGNIMFFMLSGYLISMGYRERITKRELPFKDYLYKRLKKLYPMYILSNIAMVPLSILKYGTTSANLRRIASVALLQAGGALENEFPFNGPSWFVCALFTCYILYYFIAYHSKNRTRYLCFLVAGIVLGCFLTTRVLSVPYCYYENGIAYMNFFTGCLLREIIPEIRETVRKKLARVIIPVLLVIGYMMLRYGVDQTVGAGLNGYTFVLFPLILLLANIPNVICTILGSKPFVYFGKISVTIFFWHGVLQELFLQANGIYSFTDTVFAAYMIALFPVCIVIHQVFTRKKWI